MLLNEVLTERYENEVILQRIADELNSILPNKVENQEFEKTFKRQNGELVLGEVGNLKNLVSPKTLGSLYPRLGNVRVEVAFNMPPDEGGAYDKIDKPTITLNGSWFYDEFSSRRNQIQSFLVHELKHALDDSLSGGRVTNHKKNDLRKPHKHAKPEQQYLSQQTEINARVSQAANDIAKKLQERKQRGITTPPSNTELVNDTVLPVLKKHKLDSIIFDDESGHPMRGVYELFGRAVMTPSSFPMNNKYFRKILSRLVQFAQQHQDNV